MKAKPKMKKTKAITAWGVAWLDLDGSLNDVEVRGSYAAAKEALDGLSPGGLGRDEFGPHLARITVEPYV